jgi:hypothetical protein
MTVTSLTSRQQIAVTICRCVNLPTSRTDSKNPCNGITTVQQYGVVGWQVPEPWRGDIEYAPLLFVSSNPSIDPLDDCPWNTGLDSEIIDYYATTTIARQFPYSTYRNSIRSKRPVSFWSCIHARAKELYRTSEVIPGFDYALTEIVHCKSRDELGVKEAAPKCIELYLPAVLGLSRAVVVVALGQFAHDALKGFIRENMNTGLQVGFQLVCIPHPNARIPRTATHCLSVGELQSTQRSLRQNRRVRDSMGVQTKI